MSRHRFTISLMAATFSTAALAADVMEPSAADKEFAAEAASAGMLEVRLGQYASANAGATAVRQFGETMVNDHTKANEELRAIASEKSIELPKVLSPKDQEVLDRLEKLTGAEFDKAYVAQMVKDHESVVAAFTKEVGSGAEVRVKGFAEKTLPKLRHHLEMAQAIVTKLP